MISNQNESSSAEILLLLVVLINVVVLKHAYAINEIWYWALAFTFPPFIGAAIYSKRRKKANSKSL